VSALTAPRTAQARAPPGAGGRPLPPGAVRPHRAPAAVTREQRLDERDERAGLRVVDLDDLRDERLDGAVGREVPVAVDRDDAVAVLGGGQPLRAEHGVQRDVPRLILDLGGHRPRHLAADDDGAAENVANAATTSRMSASW
jgi:hypothetical protein